MESQPSRAGLPVVHYQSLCQNRFVRIVTHCGRAARRSCSLSMNRGESLKVKEMSKSRRRIRGPYLALIPGLGAGAGRIGSFAIG